MIYVYVFFLCVGMYSFILMFLHYDKDVNRKE